MEPAPGVCIHLSSASYGPTILSLMFEGVEGYQNTCPAVGWLSGGRPVKME